MSLTSALSPISEAVAVCRDALGEVAERQPGYLPMPERETLLTELVALEAQVTELRMRTMAASGDVASVRGARDVAGWVALQTGTEPLRLRSESKVATSVDRAWPRVGAAMARGALSLEQARVITAGLDALPARIDDEARTRAEVHLVGLGTGEREDAPEGGYGPRHLRMLAERVLDVVAPEIAEEEDAKRLAALEAAAHAKTSLKIRSLGDGLTRITALVPDPIAARLATYLDAFTSPRQHHAGTGGNPDAERLPQHRARGLAFGALLEHLDPAKLPVHGGDATTVIVTIDHDQLTHHLGTAGLLDPGHDNGGELRISADHARRLACTARILPAVLGGKSEVLDLGRARRLFTAAQRTALGLRDKTCRGEGCSIPARWCEAHHLDPWSKGGKTNLDDGVLLCAFHHHLEHDPASTTTRLANGDRRYHRRT
ncbi:HNH endonuclease signature motif containing protein [Nocardioides sambongensis]|uniref:HNH endonuclease signature motif containing protein n=1 Tax=Nocardioides sambongensis TaxID=2589074 RepID=UPI001128A516|nr:HNH endonuclease signature motif containing protein [Nocardioides sambongensis]